jgi:hypothetical protein
MDELHDCINSNLTHIELHIQEAAGACLYDFLRGYGCPRHVEHVRNYCANLFDKSSSFVRLGSGVALAAVPRNVVMTTWGDVLVQLCLASHADTAVQSRDAEARVKAIEVPPSSMLRPCRTLPHSVVCAELEQHGAIHAHLGLVSEPSLASQGRYLERHHILDAYSACATIH